MRRYVVQHRHARLAMCYHFAADTTFAIAVRRPPTKTSTCPRMQLSPRHPTRFERLQCSVRRELACGLAGLLRVGGRAQAQRWLDRALRTHRDISPCFFAPLPVSRIALGALPTRACRVSIIDTIIAEWVDCDGHLFNCLDYFLGTGNWAPLIRSTNGDPVREEARQLLEADLSYKQTEVYQTLVQAVRDNPPQRRQGRQLTEVADVDRYFERFVRLFDSIMQHGMLEHAVLDRKALRFSRERGMGVAVDRNGSLHRLQGANHRWAIAQVLEIREVPVEIRLVHVGNGMALEDRLENVLA